MTKLNSYTISGTKTSTDLPKAFQEKINLNLLAQAARVYQDRSHPGLSKVKTRGEVNLTTAKVWRQKGTGRARHGARSAPIFVGGGVAHGPKGVKRTLKMSRKMAKKSLAVALSLKAKNGEIVAISNLSKIKKTKEAQKLINKIIAKENFKNTNRVSIVIKTENIQEGKAFRNLDKIQILSFENLDAMQVLSGGLLVFERELLDIFGKRGTLKTTGTIEEGVKEKTVTDKKQLNNAKKIFKIKKGTK